MMLHFREKRKKKRETQRILLEHGGKLLKERIALFDGRSNPIRNFSAHQIQKAIHEFQKNHPLQNYIDFEWLKGLLDDGRFVFIKIYPSGTGTGEDVYRDIVISSQMSSHNNVLKLLGCCLELKGPALVYEYAEAGCLDSRIHDGSLPWGTRLKIAKEIASAVTYLHCKFPRPIIHRHIKPSNIFLDHHYAAKLSDFSFAISIPEGESHVEDLVLGTWGFADPGYVATGIVTEKTDVYSLGVLLLVLLTGQKAMMSRDGERLLLVSYVLDMVEKDQVKDVVDPTMWGDGGKAIEQQQQPQVEAALELALRCIKFAGEDRPQMIEVAKELQRIEKSILAP